MLKTEKEKAIKKYKLKYDKYLVVKPATNSPFDTLIAATQVRLGCLMFNVLTGLDGSF